VRGKASGIAVAIQAVKELILLTRHTHVEAIIVRLPDRRTVEDTPAGCPAIVSVERQQHITSMPEHREATAHRYP